MTAPPDTQPRIETLEPRHDLTGFDCGSAPLNRFLAHFALASQKAGSSRTYLAFKQNEVVGYYSLTVGQVTHDEAPKRLAKGMPRHPVPVILLARLAVGKAHQGQGLGSGMLLDAIRRTLQAADIAGIRAILVHAKDEDAKAFYEHFGFEPFTTEPLTLYRLLKDIRSMLTA